MTTDYLFLATANGVVTCQRQGADWREMTRGLTHRKATSVVASPNLVLAGTTDGIFQSSDLGQTWREASGGLTTRHVRWLAFHPTVSGVVFAGVESAGIFVSRDGADTWQERPEVPPLRRKHRWFLPYSRGAGCVRGFAAHGARVYAAVEVGGVLRSDDGGETWRLAEGSSGDPDLEGPPEPLIYPDVHSIEVHPSSPDLVFAPTGGGFYRSTDGGRTWACLYDCYCRAVWADPADPDHLLLGPADGVDAQGRIEETRDGGQTWTPASAGLQTPWRRHMVERFLPVGDELLAVLSNGQLLSAPLAALEWRPILPAVKQAAAAASLRL